MAKVIEFVCFALAGMIVLVRNGRPTKLEYGLAWGCLLFDIIVELSRGM